MPKILVVGGLGIDQSLWSDVEGFRKIGYEVTYVPEFVYVCEGRKDPNKVLSDEVLKAVTDGEHDFLFWWQPKNSIWTDLLHSIRGQIPLVGHSIDDPYIQDSPNCPIDLLRQFDLMLTCCEGSIDWYNQHDIRATVGFTPCDADRHGRAQPKHDYYADFCFTATNIYPMSDFPKQLVDRCEMVREAAKIGIVKLFGPCDGRRNDWLDKAHGGFTVEEMAEYVDLECGGFLNHEETASAFASSRFTLNTHVRPDGYAYINRRVIEAMACGSCVVTDRVVGMETYLRDGIDCIMFGDLEEYVDKIRYYYTNPHVSSRIAMEGKKTALTKFDNTTLAQHVVDAIQESTDTSM